MKFILLILLLLASCKSPIDPEPDTSLEEENLVYYTLFSDSVEYGQKNWTYEGMWIITTYTSHSITSSWATRHENYLPDQDDSLISQTINLTGYYNIVLEFWHLYELEDGFDFGHVEYSIDGGVEWNRIHSSTGFVLFWQREQLEISISDIVDFRFRFRIITDATNNYRGWFIDDIKVMAVQL